jgi:hypothetical protein
MKISLRFVVIGYIQSLQKSSIQVKWYQAVRIAKEAQMLQERATILRCTILLILLTMIKTYFHAHWMKLTLTKNSYMTENRFVYPVAETMCLKTPDSEQCPTKEYFYQNKLILTEKVTDHSQTCHFGGYHSVLPFGRFLIPVSDCGLDIITDVPVILHCISR